MTNHYHKYDLPDNVTFHGKNLAIDTEAMGLKNHRDRLCVVQLADDSGDAHVVHFPTANYDAPNLRKVLMDANKCNIFHYARFDIAIIYHYMDIMVGDIFCTKIASKLTRTYTDKHGLRNVVRECLKVDMNKEQQSSNWGAETLTPQQIDYAASDVLYLVKIKQQFEKRLHKYGRYEMAQACFDFLPTRAKLDLAGWDDVDLFSHI